MEVIMARVALMLVVGKCPYKRTHLEIALDESMVAELIRGYMVQLQCMDIILGAVEENIPLSVFYDCTKLALMDLKNEDVTLCSSALAALEELRECLTVADLPPLPPRTSSSFVNENGMTTTKRARGASEDIISAQLPLESLPSTALQTAATEQVVEGEKNATSSTQVLEMRDMVGKLRRELDDAHDRIDTLVSFLRDTIAAPIQRALDKL